MFLATLSIICKCGILGIGCVSIWCAIRRGFLFQRARPTEVFKLVLSLGAQITRTGTCARTHTGKRAVQVLQRGRLNQVAVHNLDMHMCFQLKFGSWYNAVMKITFHIMEIT